MISSLQLTIKDNSVSIDTNFIKIILPLCNNNNPKQSQIEDIEQSVTNMINLLKIPQLILTIMPQSPQYLPSLSQHLSYTYTYSTPMPQQGDNQQYCYWDVRSEADFVVVICNLCISFVIFGFVLYAFWRSYQALKHGKWFIVYYLLMAWFIAYAVQYSYAIAIYQEFKDKKIDYEIVVKYSVIFEFMDFIPAFLLMSCLYYTCFHLLTQVHTYCCNEGYHLTKWQLLFYVFLKRYQIIRLFFIGPSFTLLFFDRSRNDKIKICSLLQLVLFMFDSVMCNLCLLVSLRTVRLKNQILNIDSEDQRTKLRRQSITLQIAGIFRFIMALVFIIVSGQIQSDTNPCPYPSLTRTIFYMIVGQILLHFLPVMIILSMFRISRKQLRNTMERAAQNNLSTRLGSQQISS